MKPRILIFCDFFLPGFKAGGPITTLVNTIQKLSDELDFFVVTSDRDYLSDTPYSEIHPGNFEKRQDYSIYYAKGGRLSAQIIRNILKEVQPDSIYLNSIFSTQFSMQVMLCRWRFRTDFPSVVICPRGELNPSALAKSAMRKRVFINAAKWMGLYCGVQWQASNRLEQKQISTVFGAGVQISYAPNLTRVPDTPLPAGRVKKDAGCLDLVFVGRLNKIKNLGFVLDILTGASGRINLNVVGPMDDPDYWQECETKIKALPDNIQVHINGDMPQYQVLEIIRKAHFLISPTLGENFGQAIYESFSVGIPVIISDNTPWKKLDTDGSGWDISLGALDAWRNALLKANSLDQAEWEAKCTAASERAISFGEQEKTIELTRNLFLNSPPS